MAIETTEVNPSVYTKKKQERMKAESSLQGDDLPGRKAEWYREMEEEGKILPEDHPFARILKSTGQRLKVIPEIDFYAIDTDERFALFQPDTFEIWHSSGMYASIIRYQHSLGEDHIAAINAHEAEHGEKEKFADEKAGKGQDKNEYRRNVLSNLTYAEETRADTASMRRLSKAGYNPRALIDVFRTLPLTTSRYDYSHPEIIDRIRLMEERLSDDENPLSHTGKPITPLDPALYEWLKEEREHYPLVETMLHKKPQELTEAVLQTETQHDFWNALWIKQHGLKVAAAKNFVAKNPKLMENILFKLITYDAIQYSLFRKDEELVDQEDKDITYRYNRFPSRYEDVVSTAWSYGGFNGYESVLDSGVYRQQLEPLTAQGNLHPKLSKKLHHIEWNLDTGIGRIQRSWKRPDHYHKSFITENPERDKLVRMVLESYESGMLNDDLILIAFQEIDTEYQQTALAQDNAKSAEKGFRGSGGKWWLTTVDLHDQMQRADFFEKLKLDIAVRLTPDVRISKEEKMHLIELICRETNAPFTLARYISETSLAGRSKIDMQAYLTTQDRSSYPKLVDAVLAIKDDNGKKMFSNKPLHKAYRSSLESEPERSGNWSSKKPLVKPVLMKLDDIKMALWKHLSDLYGSGERLTLEELDALASLDACKFEKRRDERVVKEYIQAIKEGKKPDEKIAQKICEIQYWHSITFIYGEKTEITPDDLIILIKNSPWDANTLYRILYRNELLEDAYNSLGDITDEQRMSVLEALKLTYDLYQGPQVEKDHYYYTNGILSFMVRVWKNFYTSQGQTELDAAINAFKTVSGQGYSLNTYYLQESIKDSDKLDTSEVQKLIDFIKNYEKTTGKIIDESGAGSEGFTPVDYLYLINEIPEKYRSAARYLGYNRLMASDVLLACLIKNHDAEAIDWLVNHLNPSTRRDRILMALLEYTDNFQVTNEILGKMGMDSLTEESYKQLYEFFDSEVFKNITFGPDVKEHSRQSPHFPYYLYVRREDWPEHIKQYLLDEATFIGKGKLAEIYPDLLKRRHPFATFTATNHNYDLPEKHMGSFNQQVYAKRLLAAEPVLFDHERSLDERVKFLENLVPFPTVVRDIHLELILREELENAENHQQKIIAGKLLLPLFTENSSLRTSLATIVLRSELSANPSVIKDFNDFIPILKFYLPEPSFARNYFLNLLEKEASLTVDQLREIIKLRLSPEGKKELDDDSPEAFIFSKLLSETNRAEKIKAVNWILGLSQEKPIQIKEIEQRYTGHLDNLPRAVLAMTDDEKAILFKRLFLGAEGILDLETVKYEIKEGEEGYKQELAQTAWDAYIAKKEFLQGLAINIFPYNMSYNAFFRNALVTILEKSEPARGSQILTRLLIRFMEVQTKGEKIIPEEIIAIGLSELGVVGKKASQALAELSQIPKSYRDLLKKAQEEGPTVPKRALLVLAEDAGLLEENSKVQIISFGKLLNAASNKQAAFLTVDVHDVSVGLSVGRHNDIIGKFKRPSAQKIENLEHDLRVLNDVIKLTSDSGLTNALPDDFVNQIRVAVTRELDFQQEQIFSRELREDIAERNKRRHQKVEIPEIYFAADDVMLEQQAQGISLRRFLDLQQSGPLTLLQEGYGNLREKTIMQGLTSELLAQLIESGRIHADAHPGNIFVDRNGKITLIDLGMHERVTPEQRYNTITLLTGLAVGDTGQVKNVLRRMGWNIGNAKLALQKLNFTQNSKILVEAMQNSTTTSPEVLSSIIYAASKLTTFTSRLSTLELINAFTQAINKRELPSILLQLLRR